MVFIFVCMVRLRVVVVVVFKFFQVSTRGSGRAEGSGNSLKVIFSGGVQGLQSGRAVLFHNTPTLCQTP